MIRSAILFLFMLVVPFVAAAVPLQGIIWQIHNDATVSLETHQKIRLAGIIIPKQSQDKAVRWLTENYVKHEILLEYGSLKTDRYHRLLAHLKTKQGKWAQQELLKLGLAYVYASADNDLYTQEMLDIEQRARENHIGIWKTRAFNIYKHSALEKQLAYLRNQFVFVEGVLFEVKKGKKRLYLNFSDDWKTDFTASILNSRKNMFKKLEPDQLIGKPIRVRGWLESYNGPFMELYHPSHLQVLAR